MLQGFNDEINKKRINPLEGLISRAGNQTFLVKGNDFEDH
jgi:hypothetical protein